MDTDRSSRFMYIAFRCPLQTLEVYVLQLGPVGPLDLSIYSFTTNEACQTLKTGTCVCEVTKESYVGRTKRSSNTLSCVSLPLPSGTQLLPPSIFKTDFNHVGRCEYPSDRSHRANPPCNLDRDTMSNSASSSKVNIEGVMLFEQPFARVSEACLVRSSPLIRLYNGRFRSRTTGRSSGRPNDK